MIKRRLLCLLLFIGIFYYYSVAWAEIKVFERDVEEAVSHGQSQEQVEAFALQKAKRLAVEEAGTYISSLTVVLNYLLQKDEVTALAAGVVQAKIVGVPAVRLEKDIIYVKVKARIDVDTSVLDRQIQVIMKEKGTLKKLEEEQKKNKALEEQLASLKSSEVKRLDELNNQAIALERERERQRLFREEQSLRAKGELSKAEAERLTREREMQDRINKTLADQERDKREEAKALAAEQDRIRRAQLENEQRWSDLARKAQLAQDQWTVIDDSLSLKQAMTEVSDLKKEIANLKLRLDYQYGENVKNLKAAYVQQISLTQPKLPPSPAPKDAFETTAEYKNRAEDHEQQVKKSEAENAAAVEKLKKEETLKLAQAQEAYIGQEIRLLEPFVKRLQDLQDRKFALPEGGVMTAELGEPDADNSRFPLRLQYKGKSWSTWWTYTDRNIARDFYRTKTYLTAEGQFQLEDAVKLGPKLTMARVTHPGTKETQEFRLETPTIFAEIDQFGKFKKEVERVKKASIKAAFQLSHKVIVSDGPFIAYDDGVAIDSRTDLMWMTKDSGAQINWQIAMTYCGGYRSCGYKDWRLPTKEELEAIVDKSRSNPAINTAIFPDTKSEYYWTSTPDANNTTDAWYVYFGSGSSSSYDKTSTYYVRCVR